MGSKEKPVNSLKPAVIHKFGDEDLLNVTLVVGGENFRFNKAALASRSTYFKAMFFSDFKEKDQEKISIEADLIAFHHLMELIYTGQFTCWKTILTCEQCTQTGTDQCVSILWTRCIALLKLADQFDVLNYTVSMLENYFLRCRECRKDCPHSGTKLLIAVLYGMEEFKKTTNATRNGAWRAVSLLEERKAFPVSFDFSHLKCLLNRP